MKRALVLAVILGFAGSLARGDDGGGSELFVNTDPIGAVVTLDGERAGVTPLRVPNFPRGPVSLNIEKSRYLTVKSEQTVGEERRKFVFFTLSSVNLRLRIDQAGQGVFINGENVGESPLAINNLPAGTYEITKDESGITISNKTYRTLRRTTLTETLLTAGFFGAALGGSIYYGGEGEDEKAAALSAGTAVFGGLLVYNLLKFWKIDTGYRKAVKDLSVVEVEPLDRKGPLEYFSEGMELIGRELWQEALAKFLYVEKAFPESQTVPMSVYEAGYCLYRLGDPAKASEYFRLFVTRYPIYELFPYGVYYLIQSGVDAGAAAKVLEDYASLRPVRLEDPSGVLHRDFSRALERLYLETGASNGRILSDMIDELDHYLSRNPRSPTAPELLLLKGRVLYAYIDKSGGSKILNDLRQTHRSDDYIRKEVDRVLNAR